MKKAQKGFGLIEVLLVIVIAGLIVVVSYILLNNQKDEPDQVVENTEVKDETADWLVYEPAGKEYKFKVADGWKLYTKEGDDKSLYSIDSLALVSEVRGQVLPHPQDAHGEFECGLSFDWYEGDMDLPDDMPIVFSTNAGLPVNGNDKLFLEDDYGGPAGTKSYGYRLIQGSKAISIGYAACPDNGDYHDVVEEVIKTIEIN
ncbi:MAG: prepilin-type N-terminal cleavage/methylation domain-containing protein [Candidatus Nomurabacteria bacterium]|jgi:prepilin-type N-terminal cleavage/methylation domain-containing protein|nr:prepilin-type N-terminal cleavage/methylation domain-containing protein [Candidatus Nomurabacteria bacterium]